MDLSKYTPALNETIMVITNGGVKKYKLKGVVYYEGDHFTSRYIGKCGVVWYHDGLVPQ